jgi:hypothetical protein
MTANAFDTASIGAGRDKTVLAPCWSIRYLAKYRNSDDVCSSLHRVGLGRDSLA